MRMKEGLAHAMQEDDAKKQEIEARRIQRWETKAEWRKSKMRTRRGKSALEQRLWERASCNWPV
jgi:hypothetical protein